MSEGCVHVEDVELTNIKMKLHAIGEIRKRIFDVILANLYRRGEKRMHRQTLLAFSIGAKIDSNLRAQSTIIISFEFMKAKKYLHLISIAIELLKIAIVVVVVVVVVVVERVIVFLVALCKTGIPFLFNKFRLLLIIMKG
ncbi:hypothetical protein T11_4883 [Trichinella zimbabwensis]|uniref:Uncharacterized protein n=1 Tax=Trichinella zimbabwensis TaxID=268475 RepID=A0A0V1H342_9BILA|nr:hypothetical protein T11_4883 [Trichinella zimbabwensis]